jgi:hypothetical protein
VSPHHIVTSISMNPSWSRRAPVAALQQFRRYLLVRRPSFRKRRMARAFSVRRQGVAMVVDRCIRRNLNRHTQSCLGRAKHFNFRPSRSYDRFERASSLWLRLVRVLSWSCSWPHANCAQRFRDMPLWESL